MKLSDPEIANIVRVALGIFDSLFADAQKPEKQGFAAKNIGIRDTYCNVVVTAERKMFLCAYDADTQTNWTVEQSAQFKTALQGQPGISEITTVTPPHFDEPHIAFTVA